MKFKIFRIPRALKLGIFIVWYATHHHLLGKNINLFSYRYCIIICTFLISIKIPTIDGYDLLKKDQIKCPNKNSSFSIFYILKKKKKLRSLNCLPSQSGGEIKEWILNLIFIFICIFLAIFILWPIISTAQKRGWVLTNCLHSLLHTFGP